MGKKEEAKIPVTLYYMSLLYGVCAGPVDRLIQVYIADDKEVLEKMQVGPTVTRISKENLFGGKKEQGGLGGLMHFLPGDATQKLSNFLAAKFGRTPNTAPAYRNICTLMFTGANSPDLTGGSEFTVVGSTAGYGLPGFYWSANQPIVQSVKAKVSRIDRDWYPSKAEIPHVRYGKVDPMQICILWDLSPSIHPDEFEATKTAINAALDEIESYIESNPDAKFAMQIASPPSIFFPSTIIGVDYSDLDAAKIAALRAYVAGAVRRNSHKYDSVYSLMIRPFFDGGEENTKYSRRIIVEMSRGFSDSYRSNAKAGSAADLFNQSSFPFSAFQQNPVDMYGICHSYSEGSSLSKPEVVSTLSNQGPAIVVPAQTGGNHAGQTEALLSCIRPKSLEPDMNPAHMIRQCLVNTDFGMSAPDTMLDLDSFTDAADTLYAEEFGLSMLWAQQTDIESFIQEILDHIEATLFVHPVTGLITLKLIRYDYNPATLPILDKNNCHVRNFQRKLLGETINEIVVTWTNPVNEQEETVTFQNLANIQLQGGVISDSRNYYGVRSAGLAKQLAIRDIRTASAPLVSCEIEVTREAWSYVPGDVIKLSYPEHGVEEMILRIGSIDYGKPGEPTIKVSCLEDVWGLPMARYVAPDDGLYENPNEAARESDYQFLMTAPYFLATNLIPASLIATAEYPDAFTIVLAAQEGSDTPVFDLLIEETDITGAVAFNDGSERDTAARGQTNIEFPAEVTTNCVISNFADLTQGRSLEQGGFVVFEDDESNVEFALIYSVTGANVVLKRGVLDTTPKQWLSGSTVWIIAPGQRITDNTVRSVAETADYKILPKTSSGRFSEASAPVESYTLSDRAYLPLRPANCKVNGVGFGAVDVNGVDPIPLTWAHRNRLTEDSIVLAWDAASVTPEVGQTTTIELCDSAGTVITSFTGLSGTTYNLAASELAANSTWLIRFKSERDGDESLQGHGINVVTADGYGYGYGLNYGGA